MFLELLVSLPLGAIVWSEAWADPEGGQGPDLPPLPGKSQVAIGLLTDSGRDRSREAIGPGYILVSTALKKQLDPLGSNCFLRAVPIALYNTLLTEKNVVRTPHGGIFWICACEVCGCGISWVRITSFSHFSHV